jgi:hypothetical protein
MAQIVEITSTPEAGPALSGGATRCDRLKLRFKEVAARLFDRLGIPGFVRSMTLKDEVTGQTISVQTGHLSTRISIDGRDYYFDRLSGRFDGTGMNPTTQPACCKPADTQG